MKRNVAEHGLPADAVYDFVEDRKDRIGEAFGIEIGENLGCGRWGCAFEVPETLWVLKVTRDVEEGMMWQKLWSLQKGGERLPGLPEIVQVASLRSDHRMVADKPLYAVVREAVMPDIERAPLRESAREHLVAYIYDWHLSAAEFYGAETEHTRSIWRASLRNIGNHIVAIGGVASPFGETLLRLLELAIPPVDTHPGNIGVRQEEQFGRPPSIVFVDPGVSPGGERVQQELVANPRPNPWVTAVCSCGSIPEEQIEVFEMEENPALAGYRPSGIPYETGARPDPSKPFYVTVHVVGQAPGQERMWGPFKDYNEALHRAQALAADRPEVEKAEVLQIDESAPSVARSGRTSAFAVTKPRRKPIAALERARGMAESFAPEQPPTWRSSSGELVINPSAPRSEWRKRQVILDEALVAKLFDWHGGQFTATYALASSGLRDLVSLSMIDDALGELEREQARLNNEELGELLGELQGVRIFWKEQTAKEAGMGLTEEEYDFDQADYGDEGAVEYSQNSAARHEMAKQWMREHAEGYGSDWQALGEGAARAVGETHWIAEPEHPVWQWAMVATLAPRAMEEASGLRIHAEEVRELVRRGQADEADALRAEAAAREASKRVGEALRAMRPNASSACPTRENPDVAAYEQGRQKARKYLGMPRVRQRVLAYANDPKALRESAMSGAPYFEFGRDFEEYARGYADEINEEFRRGEAGEEYEPNARCPAGMKVQTIVFDKDSFTKTKAKAWAKRGGYRYGDVDEKADTWRFRQEDPKRFKKAGFRTIEMDEGVKAVVGCPK